MSLSIEQKPGFVRVRSHLSPAWSIGFIAIGVLLTWFFSTSYSVSCIRLASGQVDARIRTQRPGCAATESRVTDLRSVRIDASDNQNSSREVRRRRRDGDGVTVTINHTRRVVLLDGQGLAHPVSESFTAGLAKHVALRDAIQKFLSDPKATQTTARPPLDAWRYAFLLLPALGVILLLFGQGECRLDASTGVLHLVRSPWLPLTQTIPLDEIQHFDIKIRHVRKPRGRGETATAQPFLVRTDGRRGLLTWVWTADVEDTRAAVQALEKARLAALSGPPSPEVAGAHPGRPLDLRTVPGPQKICVLCGQDCGDSPRLQDDSGRYYHRDCHHRAVLQGTDPAAS